MNEDLKSPELDRLFTAYRAATPDIDGSAGFMPALWTRIDAKRAFNRRFRLWSHGMLTAALAGCLAMGAFLVTQNAPDSDYVEVLEADNHIYLEGTFQPANYEPGTRRPEHVHVEPWTVVEEE